MICESAQELGGVRFMVLSHRDDVCDHAKWAKALGCQRIIHKVGAAVITGMGCPC